MEYQNKGITIAGKKTIREWNECLKKLDGESTVQDWEYAFSFFNDRITTRYLNPIKKILDMSLSTGEGFAVVNLQCSLIETIESFYNGWVYKYPDYYLRKVGPDNKQTRVNGKYIFNNFFEKRLILKHEDFKKFENSFFYDVRCGLLHETQTKNGWVIWEKHSDENIFFENIGEEKIIYRNNFQKAIEEVIKNYKREMVELSVGDLRENFKAKFDHICDISQLKLI